MYALLYTVNGIDKHSRHFFYISVKDKMHAAYCVSQGKGLRPRNPSLISHSLALGISLTKNPVENTFGPNILQ